jgi:hypothetical protein
LTIGKSARGKTYGWLVSNSLALTTTRAKRHTSRQQAVTPSAVLLHLRSVR